MRLPRLSWLALLLVGCGSATSEPQTIITVEVRSDLLIPGDINQLVFRVFGDPKNSRTYELGPGVGRINKLPASFAVVRDSDEVEKVEVEVRGNQIVSPSSTVEIVSRNVRVAFWPGANRPITIDLALPCAKAACAAGKTCVPGWGCVDPDIDADGVPTARRNGPPCDCNSYFPICVGARWEYRVCPPPRNDCQTKTWHISDWAKIGDSDDDRKWGVAGLDAFVQVRILRTDRSRRWLTSDAEGRRLQWQKDLYYGWPNWEVKTTFFYRPNKLRIDARHVMIGEPWQEMYEEIAVKDATEPLVKHTDEWEVVPVPMDYPPEFLLPLGQPLCHRRRDDNGFATNVATFCFVRGIGKVFEDTANVGFERLLPDYSIPGCPVRSVPK